MAEPVAAAPNWIGFERSPESWASRQQLGESKPGQGTEASMPPQQHNRRPAAHPLPPTAARHGEGCIFRICMYIDTVIV
ncbi:hypothetical protein CRG98_047370 [Punica granatum]|uniref:Uncharacterized protein n=1 Tax=Punica granatum TaxID=22663 RepID=A0A2I0HKQ2_PUNGR|nr:hypothetical protein CRG98_047370 [Punica granatum]